MSIKQKKLRYEFEEDFIFISRDKRLLNMCYCCENCDCSQNNKLIDDFCNELKDDKIKYVLLYNRENHNKRRRRKFI